MRGESVGGRGRIFPCWEAGTYGCQNDGLREADTMVREGEREGGMTSSTYPFPIGLVLEGDEAVALAVARVAVLAHLGREGRGREGRNEDWRDRGREEGREGRREGGMGGTYLCPHNISANGILEVFLQSNVIRLLGQVPDEKLEAEERHLALAEDEDEDEEEDKVPCCCYCCCCCCLLLLLLLLLMARVCVL